MAVFDLMRNQLTFTFWCVSTTVNGKVSFDRLNEFLHNVCQVVVLFSYAAEYLLDRASGLVHFERARYAGDRRP
jgi:hypothetical protein